ncbi:MAG: T9SS type A sorting domain-containing protein [Bacteroidales bacterium]|nr:T9SS type A sorting domain-containing protein [Bacteroidales bacterium]MBN2762839.1 T9SS type A sorting domain-containing protein [Bacteroidales bacterium]
MKRHLLVFALLFAPLVIFAQQELVIDDFTGNMSSGIGEAVPQPDWGSGVSVISYEDDQMKSEFSWIHADWYPRAVWYNFIGYYDLSETPVMTIKFMVTDDVNETIPVRFDLYGDGAEPYNDTIRTVMETNGNPWTFLATKDEWYTLSDDFAANNRFYCTYWNGNIPATRVDSTQINGFEAFSHYGDTKYNNQAGTLFIDYIIMSNAPVTGIEKLVAGKKNAFGLALYPNPASEYLNINAENPVSVIRIMDTSGKIIFTDSHMSGKKFTLSLTSFSKGLYIASVTDIYGNTVNKKVQVR